MKEYAHIVLNDNIKGKSAYTRSFAKISKTGVLRFRPSNPDRIHHPITMSIQKPGTSGDFIIDCDRQDIYLRENRKNMNNEFVLSNGEFFELEPGRNKIECTGLYLDQVWITPNWWTV